MNDSRHRRLAERAAKQHGVFTRDDAVEAGLSESSVADGVSHGKYRKLLPTVYAIAGSRTSLQQRLVAAVLSMPALAAISHRTAAEMWRLTDRGIGTVDVVRDSRQRRGSRVARSRSR